MDSVRRYLTIAIKSKDAEACLAAVKSLVKNNAKLEFAIELDIQETRELFALATTEQRKQALDGEAVRLQLSTEQRHLKEWLFFYLVDLSVKEKTKGITNQKTKASETTKLIGYPSIKEYIEEYVPRECAANRSFNW